MTARARGSSDTMKNESITIPLNIDTAPAKAQLEQFVADIGGATLPFISSDGQWRMDLRISVGDKGIAYEVAGVRPVPKGIPGETYFEAPTQPPEGRKVYLNGECVHNRCRECDLVGGWCSLYEKHPSGRDGEISAGLPPRVHFGRVELRHDD